MVAVDHLKGKHQTVDVKFHLERANILWQKYIHGRVQTPILGSLERIMRGYLEDNP